MRVTGIEAEPVVPVAGAAYGQLDVQDKAAVARLAEGTARLDVLVNCAAITARGEEMALRLLREGRGHQPARHVPHGGGVPWAAEGGGGCVINISSMYASFGSPRNPAYGASKAAVTQLTKSLAIAWAADGIRVNAVAPGFIVTQQSARSRHDPAHVANVSARTPMGRWGQPEDIAGPVLFLASPAAGFMTGTCLAVDGGYSVV